MKTFIKFTGLTITIAQLAAASAALGQAAPAPAVAAPAAAAPATTKTNAPRIQFSETTFDFGKAKPTDTLRHDFIVTNTGTAVLEVTAVQPGCGCTVAGTWDRQVEPGKTGKIPIQFNAGSYNGRVTKGITVTCNDPAQATHALQILATIWHPIDVQPPYVNFLQIAGEETNETKVVRIINNLDEAVTLEPPVSASALFKPEVKTVRAGKEFELHVNYLGPVSNAIPQGGITIKTSTTNMPVLNVTAYAMPQPALVPLPSLIQLPGGPLKPDYRYPATVRNNGSLPVKLSDPAVNVEGATVEVKETLPGKVFALNLAFPANFQARPGQPMELTVKTTHPKFPLIRVPIMQAAAPPPPPPPAVPASGSK